jgi:hypothetical protein
MDYLVTAADGKQYGPVTVDQLREWVRDDRVRPETQITDFRTGQAMPAGAVPGLFSAGMAPPPNWSVPPTAVPAQARNDDGRGVLIGVIIRSALAFLLFFVFHGIGLIVAGFSLAYAFQSKGRGHKYGVASIGIAAATFVIIGIGWIIRLKSGSV